MEQHADSLGRISVPAEPVAVVVLTTHYYHHCEEGQNTAGCGYRLGSEPLQDAAGFTVRDCPDCLKAVRKPCGFCCNVAALPEPALQVL
jgi:hypothetical protein